MCPREECLAALRRTRIVVRAPKAAAVIGEFNVPTALAVPEPNTWREIVLALESNEATLRLKAKRIGVQEPARPALRERGAEVFPVRVYRWELPEDTAPLKAAVRALANREIDIVMFTSSVQSVHAARMAGGTELRDQFIEALTRSVVASIGPGHVGLRNNDIPADLEASHPKIGFLVKRRDREKRIDAPIKDWRAYATSRLESVIFPARKSAQSFCCAP
jgi:uroporphyrinogen-III synthase